MRSLRTFASIGNRLRPRASWLDADEILATIDASGPSDPGRDLAESGLRALLHECRKADRLSALGITFVRHECRRLLENRSRMAVAWRDRPAVLQTEIRRPVFIVGLPRTGTTFLHHLLSRVQGHTAPRLWELLDPAAARADDPPARRSAMRTVFWTQLLNPGLRNIHPLRFDDPEECAFLLEHSFRSILFGTGLDVPGYVAWLLQQDLRPAYEDHKRQLQLIASRRPRDVWVLKSPAHTYALDALLATYPDARVIHIHRDVADVVASLCDLRLSLQYMTSSTMDPHRTGEHTVRALRAITAKAMSARRSLPEEQFLDLQFDQLITRPASILHRIDGFLGTSASQDPAIPEWLARNGRSFALRHPCSLESFGLERDGVKKVFARYRSWVAGLNGSSDPVGRGS